MRVMKSNETHGWASATHGAIAGIRVIDLSRVLAGPLCTQMLADHGASVLKVEPPQGDETRALGPPFVGDTAAYFNGLNRNKAAIALDLNLPSARDVLLRFLEGADVLVENFLPGTMEKWGLGYDSTLAQRFPRLIYCRISGFGADGPLGGLPGYDAVLQAMGGVMSVNGEAADDGTRVGIPIVDITTGMNAAFGIMLALAERARSGTGQLVDICLYDTALSLLIPHAANWFASGQVPRPMGSAHPNIAPYDKFATAEGDMFLGVANDAQFRKFCVAIDRPQWIADARYRTGVARIANREALTRDIEGVLRAFSAEDLCVRLMAAGVPAGPLNDLAKALDHPHTRHRRMVVEVDGVKGLGVPVKLSRTPGAALRPPPAFGGDTRASLAAAGYADAKIEQLISEKAVHVRPATARAQRTTTTGFQGENR